MGCDKRFHIVQNVTLVVTFVQKSMFRLPIYFVKIKLKFSLCALLVVNTAEQK